MKKLLIPLFLIISLTQLNAQLCSERFATYLEEVQLHSPENYFQNQYKTFHTTLEDLTQAAHTEGAYTDPFDYHAEFQYLNQYGETMQDLAKYYINALNLLITDNCDVPTQVQDELALFSTEWVNVLEGSLKPSIQTSDDTPLTIVVVEDENFNIRAESAKNYAQTVFHWQQNAQKTHNKLVQYLRGLLEIVDQPQAQPEANQEEPTCIELAALTLENLTHPSAIFKKYKLHYCTSADELVAVTYPGEDETPSAQFAALFIYHQALLDIKNYYNEVLEAVHNGTCTTSIEYNHYAIHNLLSSIPSIINYKSEYASFTSSREYSIDTLTIADCKDFDCVTQVQNEEIRQRATDLIEFQSKIENMYYHYLSQIQLIQHAATLPSPSFPHN